MISAVILTKNEEKNIKECIRCLDICREIIVVDDGSTDNTVKIAKSLGAKVYKRNMNMDFSAQSNFGMNKAKGEWILFVDADERVGKKLSKEISGKVSVDKYVNAFYIKRRDVIWGKELNHGESGNIKLMRLVRKGSGKWKRRVHPYFEIKGKTSELENMLLHYPHKDITSFIISVDRWSTWHSLANYEEGKNASAVKICFWPVLHFSKNYLIKLGFLDGIQGFVFAVMMSFHSFLAWNKLYLKQKNVA